MIELKISAETHEELRAQLLGLLSVSENVKPTFESPVRQVITPIETMDEDEQPEEKKTAKKSTRKSTKKVEEAKEPIEETGKVEEPEKEVEESTEPEPETKEEELKTPKEIDEVPSKIDFKVIRQITLSASDAGHKEKLRAILADFKVMRASDLKESDYSAYYSKVKALL